MEDPRKSIYIAVLNQGSFRVELTQLILELDRRSEFQLLFDFPSDKPIAHNRNKIVQRFLESGCDYLMMLDGDIIPPIHVLDLVKYEPDVIGALCYAYKGDGILPLALEARTERNKFRVYRTENPHGVHEVDAIGTGCIVIARHVLEDVKAPFLNYYDDDGVRTIGLDLSFCQKAKKQGYDVCVHLDMECSHWTEVDLKQIYGTVTESDSSVREIPMDTRIV